MKRFIWIFFAALLMTQTALAETILWEDDSGRVLLGDDGNIEFVAPDGEPDELEDAGIVIDEAYEEQPQLTLASVALQPIATSTPQSLGVPEKTLQYGDAGEHVLAAQEKLTELGYYFGQCSGRYLDGTQSAVRRFQKYNHMKETGKLDAASWERLFSKEVIARDGTTPYCTPTPTPEATPFVFVYTKKLEYGDKGELVSQLQQRLLELGFYEAKVSGGYYKVTRSAVRAFQSHNGLVADGVAGQQTQELLFSEYARSVKDAPLPSPTPAPTKYKLMVDVTNQVTRAYTYDENGEYTVLVREMLCSTGTKSNPTPLGTTIMPKSRARWGYFPTWDSHAQYLTRIDSANAFHSVLYSAPDETTLAVNSFKALGSRASHGCVRLYVSDAKWIYENCQAGTIITVYEDDVYDPEAVMRLRRSLNQETLRENPLPKPTPEPVYCEENWPKKYRTLSRGKTGEDVFMVQMRLAELGYYKGTVTGGYYGGTIEAVKTFQKDHGLTVDGAAGVMTQSVLFSREAEPQSTAAQVVETMPLTPEPTATPTPQPTATPEPAEFVPVMDNVG